MSQASDPSTPSRRAKVTKPAAAKVVSPDEPAPPCFVRKLRKAAVGTGCDIRLRVSVLGNPEPKLKWYRNKEPLPPSEAQDPGGLWIRDCRTCDAGLYTCVASNTLGEATSSTVLAVMDLGEARSAVTLSAHTSGIHVPVNVPTCSRRCQGSGLLGRLPVATNPEAACLCGRNLDTATF
ncbi:unnamed protein product [Arctogadus glacialis]